MMKTLTVLGLIACATTQAMGQTTLATTTFDASADGWDSVTSDTLLPFAIVGTFAPTWVATGGNGGGFIRRLDPDAVATYWRAPAAYMGDKSAAYGGTLSWDMIQSTRSGQVGAVTDVVLQGAGLTLVFEHSYTPETRWTRYHAPLMVGVGWRVGTLAGALATEQQLRDVLGAVTGLFLRCEYSTANETNSLDNVVLKTPSPIETATSGFDVDLNRWWVTNDANAPTWIATGGNPGGYAQATDRGDGRYWQFLAPEAFLGNRSFMIDLTLRMDLKASAGGSGGNTGLCTLSTAGYSLEYFTTTAPSTTWTSYAIPLREGAGWVRQPGATPATRADFQTLLAGITEFRILGEWSASVDVGGIDNVRLDCVPVISGEPAAATVCPSLGATLTTLAFGPAPLAYEWRWTSTNAQTITLTNGVNADPATGATFVVSGATTHECTISPDGPQHPSVLNGLSMAVTCVVSNACGSDEATTEFRVCPADFDCSGGVDGDDVIAFFGMWDAGEIGADFTGDGGVDGDDVIGFFGAWDTGC
jgi:hypothetical protein